MEIGFFSELEHVFKETPDKRMDRFVNFLRTFQEKFGGFSARKLAFGHFLRTMPFAWRITMEQIDQGVFLIRAYKYVKGLNGEIPDLLFLKELRARFFQRKMFCRLQQNQSGAKVFGSVFDHADDLKFLRKFVLKLTNPENFFIESFARAWFFNRYGALSQNQNKVPDQEYHLWIESFDRFLSGHGPYFAGKDLVFEET